MTFKREAELDAHMRSETPCDLVSKTTEEEECSEEQQKALKARPKFTGTMTEEDRWRAMYMILFPDARIAPSPCKKASGPFTSTPGTSYTRSTNLHYRLR